MIKKCKLTNAELADIAKAILAQGGERPIASVGLPPTCIAYALRELKARREAEEYGTCADCGHWGACERFIDSRVGGFKLSYCASKEETNV